MLPPATIRPFSYFFLQEAHFLLSMDAVMHIPLSVFQRNDDKYKDVGSFDGIARNVMQVLELALEDRVKLIRVLTTHWQWAY